MDRELTAEEKIAELYILVAQLQLEMQELKAKVEKKTSNISLVGASKQHVQAYNKLIKKE